MVERLNYGETFVDVAYSRIFASICTSNQRRILLTSSLVQPGGGSFLPHCYPDVQAPQAAQKVNGWGPYFANDRSDACATSLPVLADLLMWRAARDTSPMELATSMARDLDMSSSAPSGILPTDM